MATAPILYPSNYLELGITSVLGAATGFPKERLYDRDIGLPWKDSASGSNRAITVAPSSSAPNFTSDTLIIAAGHTLAVQIQYETSPDGSSWTLRDFFTPADFGLQRRTIVSQTHVWWRLLIIVPASAPQIPELFFTHSVPLPMIPLLGGFRVGQEANLVELESYGGHAWTLVKGERRWTAVYPFFLTDAERTALDAAHAAAMARGGFLYLLDAEGVVRWVQWLDQTLEFTNERADLWGVTLRFRQVLGAAA